MLAPTSTRNGACWMGRGLIGTDARNCAFDGLGQFGRLRQMARLRHLPENHVDLARAAAEDRHRHALGLGHAAGFLVGAIEAEEEDLCAGGRASQRRVGVEADEHVGLVVVGKRRALVERQRAVVVARQQHAGAEARFQSALDATRDRQRQRLLQRAARAFGPVLVAAMARDRSRWCARRRRQRQRRGLWRRRRGGTPGVAV